MGDGAEDDEETEDFSISRPRPAQVPSQLSSLAANNAAQELEEFAVFGAGDGEGGHGEFGDENSGGLYDMSCNNNLNHSGRVLC